MNTLQSLPPETRHQESPGPCSQACADEPSPISQTNFLSLPPEILTQIANETHAIDAYNLRLVHSKLNYLFRPENNLFWFKATLKDYIVHYGPPPKSSPSNSEASGSAASDNSQGPHWDALWRLNLMSRMSDVVRGSSRLKEQLCKYDPNFKYFDRIKTAIDENRGCQVCFVRSHQESKYYLCIDMRLCGPCFDDLTINRPKLRYLKLADNAYRFIKYRRKNGSVQYACWLPDVLKALPPNLGFTSIHDIERTHDLKHNATKTALSDYRDRTRESVQRAAIEVFTKDPAYAGFRTVFPVDKMEDYVYGLETIDSVEKIVRLCKKQKTTVWCTQVAKKDILPKFEIVEDETFQGQKKWAILEKHGKPVLVIGGKRALKGDGVPRAIRSAVFNYHEKRFVKLGAGWDHRAGDKLMFGYCQICMDKKLQETGDLQRLEVERRKRKRDVTDDGSEEQETENVDAGPTRANSPQQLSPLWTALNSSAYPTPLSPTQPTASSPTPLSLSSPSRQKRQKQTNTEAEVALAEYLPKLYTAEAAASFPTIPITSLNDPQQVRYTGAELAAHYEARHIDKFYSGETQGPGRKYERGKEGYWFWNLGDNVDDGDDQTEGQQGQTDDALAEGQLGENDSTSDTLSTRDETGPESVDSFDVGQGSSFRSFAAELDPPMRVL